jgi:hypothetical protein
MIKISWSLRISHISRVVWVCTSNNRAVICTKNNKKISDNHTNPRYPRLSFSSRINILAVNG